MEAKLNDDLKRPFTSDDEKDGNVGLRGTLVEVDWSDGDHAERDDDGDAARDRAPDRAQQQQQKLHKKVDEVARSLKIGNIFVNDYNKITCPVVWYFRVVGQKVSPVLNKCQGFEEICQGVNVYKPISADR